MSELGNKLIFSKNLKKYMEINNVDRNSFCEKVGVPYTTVSDWLNAKTYPRIDTIERIADFFDIPKADLIDGVSYGFHDDTIKLIDNKYVKLIPVLGKIPAGVPFEAIQEAYTTDYVAIPLEMTKGGKEYFALKIKGNSMEPDYKDGSTVVFLKTCDFNSGDDCCVLLDNNDATFKKVKIKEDGLLIEPINYQNDTGFYQQLYSKERVQAGEVRILGVVKGFYKFFK